MVGNSQKSRVDFVRFYLLICEVFISVPSISSILVGFSWHQFIVDEDASAESFLASNCLLQGASTMSDTARLGPKLPLIVQFFQFHVPVALSAGVRVKKLGFGNCFSRKKKASVACRCSIA